LYLGTTTACAIELSLSELLKRMASIFNDVSISYYPPRAAICNRLSAGSKLRDGIREILLLTHQGTLYWSHYKHDFLLDGHSKTSADKCEFIFLSIRKKAKALFYGILPDFRKNANFWDGHRRHPFALLVTATCGFRRVWRICMMVVTEEKRSTGRKPVAVSLCPTQISV
jgi:hypothetical protein